MRGIGARPVRRGWLAAALVTAAVLASGCGGGAPTPARSPTPPAATPPATTPAAAAPTGVGRPDHVVVAIFENKDYAQIAGSAQAPYLNALMARGAVLTNSRGIAHPSQPNYLALFSGSTQGITDNRCFAPLANRPNLGRQLLDAGLTFRGYAEDLPTAGYRGCTSGGYAAKHNPWVHFANLPAAVNQPFRAFPTDYATLPTVAFVVPNLCNAMHDCSVSTGDGWARAHLDPYLRWAVTHNSLLVVTFDENDGRAGNRILTVVAGARVTPGHIDEPADHYRILRTIENLYQLPALGEAAARSPLAGLWN